MKKILWMLAMLLPVLARAQVSLQPSVPAVGLIQKEQLWNVLLVNSTTKQYACRLDLLLRDRATGQEILTASTGQFVLQSGARQMNVNTLAPIRYNYILTGFDGRLQGLLPAGSYTACYSLSSATVKETGLADDCVQFDTEPLTPPMLVYPTDSSVQETAPNQFSWIPPTPAGMFNRLQYDVLITPINDGQKASEAIEENLPFYSEGGHISPMLNYSGASPVFEKDKWYAWQVVARDGRNYAGKSEVWVFKVKEENKIAHIIQGTPYIRTKTDTYETGIAPNGILKLAYFNRYIDSVVSIYIKDLSDNNNMKQPVFSATINAGDNLIQYDLKKIMHLTENTSYQAELINSKGEKWTILFRMVSFKN